MQNQCKLHHFATPWCILNLHLEAEALTLLVLWSPCTAAVLQSSPKDSGPAPPWGNVWVMHVPPLLPAIGRGHQDGEQRYGLGVPCSLPSYLYLSQVSAYEV